MANPGDRRSYKRQFYKLGPKSGRHVGRSTTLGCTDDEEAERRALLHGRMSSLGRILECGAQLAKKETHSYVWCPNCGLMYYKADRLNVSLNLRLAVAVIMLGPSAFGIGWNLDFSLSEQS